MRTKTAGEAGWFSDWITRADDLQALCGALAGQGWDPALAGRLGQVLQGLAEQAAQAEWHQLGQGARELLAQLDRLQQERPAPDPGRWRELLTGAGNLADLIVTSEAVRGGNWDYAMQSPMRLPEGWRLSGLGSDVGRLRMKQALLNLISNTIKYNPAGGGVRLHCYAQPSGVIRFSVKDSGIGIPLDKQDRPFLPFERLGAERSHVGGTGIAW